MEYYLFYRLLITLFAGVGSNSEIGLEATPGARTENKTRFFTRMNPRGRLRLRRKNVSHNLFSVLYTRILYNTSPLHNTCQLGFKHTQSGLFRQKPITLGFC